VGTVNSLSCRLFSWLRKVGRALCEILSLFLLLVDDFLVVRDVSWI
jgi:hypothetical protein